MSIRAIVHNRRLVVDGEFELPEGTELRLVIDEDADATIDPTIADKVRAAFDRVESNAATPAAEVQAELRSMRESKVPRRG